MKRLSTFLMSKAIEKHSQAELAECRHYDRVLKGIGWRSSDAPAKMAPSKTWAADHPLKLKKVFGP